MKDANVYSGSVLYDITHYDVVGQDTPNRDRTRRNR